MNKLILSLICGFSLSLPAFAGHGIYMAAPDYSALDDFMEAQAQAQYEAQVQQQLEALAARQQAIENLLIQRQQYLEELLGQ